MHKIILYPGEDGYWVVECPSLPGCVSQGKTKAEARANIREAIEGYEAALDKIFNHGRETRDADLSQRRCYKGRWIYETEFATEFSCYETTRYCSICMLFS